VAGTQRPQRCSDQARKVARASRKLNRTRSVTKGQLHENASKHHLRIGFYRQRHNDPPPLRDQLCYAIYTAGIAVQRAYKPLLDELGLTYPQYLALNMLWAEDEQIVVSIADRLALESSTLTPLLKRLETAGHLRSVDADTIGTRCLEPRRAAFA
jgi:hypothetical protein